MVGKSLSHYKIEAELGRGGMGIVYKAEDTKLDRTVAIKVLPSAALASDEDRARFYREAKAAAALTHPNIAIVHAVDEAVPEDAPHGTEVSLFIAMEFIDGETLHDWIQKGPLKLEEAVRIVSEIASALEAAHEKSIVHRDIKSANVMLTEKGSAKVLDFGLAQTAQSTKLTRMGSTLGTVAYMSPEQARGEEVDRRTDLWSLGAVLYEMIAGKSPFPGDYEQAVVYEILNQDPEPLTAVRTGVPMGLEWIISKCLAKKADNRYQNATDLLVDLKNVDLTSSGMSRISSVMPPAATGPSTQIGSWRANSASDKPALSTSIVKAWPVIALAFIGALGLGYALFSSAGDESENAKLETLQIHLDGIYDVDFPVVSPTSDFLAFTGRDTLERTGIFLYDVGKGSISFVDGSDGGQGPQFSPDGSQLVYSDYGRGIMSTEVPLGAPRTVISGGYDPIWEGPESLVYNTLERGLSRFNLVTSEQTPLVYRDSSANDTYWYGLTSIDSESRIGYGHRLFPSGRGSTIMILDLESKDGDHAVRYGVENDVSPQYVPGGYLLFQKGTSFGPFVVRPIDRQTGAFIGPPIELDAPSMSSSGLSVGSDGSIIYASNLAGRGQHLFLYDLDQKRVEKLVSNGGNLAFRPSYSPDGNTIAVYEIQDDGPEVLISNYVIDQQRWERRTTTKQRRDPAWSANGSLLYFDGRRSDSPGIYVQELGSVGQETVLISGEAAYPTLSPNGKWLSYTQSDVLYQYNLATGESSVIDSTRGPYRRSDFSPDSQFLAVEATSGRDVDIVILSMSSDFRQTLSQAGASEPHWAPDGKTLYFSVMEDGIYKVAVTKEPEFQILGQPQKVVDVVVRSNFDGQSYDISPDGETLAITGASVSNPTSSKSKGFSHLTWIRNWAQSLSRD